MEKNISIRLDHGTLRIVTRIARRRGQTRSQVIRAAIENFAEAETPGETMYDRVKHLIGSVRSGRKDLSTQTGRKLAERLRRRRRR